MFSKVFYFIVFVLTLVLEVRTQAGGMGGMIIDYAEAFDQELYESVIDEEKCDEQLEFLSNNSDVSMLFQDATGKIPTGFLSGNLADLGDYHQCLGIRHVDRDMEIDGKYCMMQYPLKQMQENATDAPDDTTIPPNIEFPNISDIFPPLSNRTLEDIKQYRMVQRYAQGISGAGGPFVSRVIPVNFASAMKMTIGTCVPKVCRAKQVVKYFQQKYLGNTDWRDNNVTVEEFFCRLPNDRPFSIADYLAIGIFSLIGAITVLSTSYDLFQKFALKKKSSEVSTLYRSFSVYTNTRRFLTFSQPAGSLECVDGIRAVSMLWVIFGHTYCLTMLTFVQNVQAVKQWLTSFTSVWVNSAPITVDTFFLLSGVLCVYTVVGKITRWRFITSLHMFYLYRILRILPLLAAVILLQASLFHRMSDGPMWLNMGHMVLMCRRRWWSALLHVQNYVKPMGICLYQTWYLSVDLQLYLFSPAVLVWLFGSQAVAWCALGTIIMVSLVLSTTFSFLYNYSAALANPGRVDQFGDYFTDYYINTLTRAPPFFVGMMYGYLLLRCKGRKIRINKILVWVIWVMAFLLMAFCIFTTYPVMQEDFHLQALDNFLNSYMRAIWALAVGWLIFACVHGYGGPINWFLSLQMWKLPARLSYAMYLTHYPIMMVSNGSMVGTHFFTDGNTIYRALGDLAFATIAAFVLSITIDAPCSTLQKLLLGGAGKKKPEEKVKVESQNNEEKKEPEEKMQDEKTNL
ncbi:nose resistant to fluoxetine protein 6-like [Bicyclus anynana]|uniref:Nose resistant to fluoxetine protein 6-like n=1 Tax=Bicyclus anynana TaxID=110368 RepID=A0ABM3LR18_BICAN|nr:nose resistant to fluoxetine protein 6-like [Bicyclus anynana]